MLRLRDLDFLARMWLPKARSRISLPEPETLMRLAAPLCVFNFGIFIPLVIVVISRYDQVAVEVGNYFFRTETDRLRPENWGLPSMMIRSPSSVVTRSKSWLPNSL